MINKQTTLALNGPILSFTQQPSAVTINHSGIATFSGIATAIFPTQTPENPGLNDGSITYQWYATGVNDPLSNGTFRGATLSGTATTTLTVSGAVSPTTNATSFFLRADYTPSAYSQPVGSPVTAGTARSTGRDVARGVNSNAAVLTVRPFITITTQPQNVTVATDSQAFFNVTATISDTSFGELTYQWQRSTDNGVTWNNLTDATSPLVSGSATRSLILTSPSTIGTTNIRVIVRNASAQEVASNSAILTTVAPRPIIVFEGYNTAETNNFQKVERNLSDVSGFTLSDTTFTHNPNIITFYASERDIDTELKLDASKGADRAPHTGGNGGSSRIRLTLQKNVEHTIIGIQNNSAVFLYRGSNLIAVVGEGGDAGTGGNGGAGGGVNDAGQAGSGTNAGTGGARETIGENGVFGSASTSTAVSPDTKATAPSGGRTISCSKGNYWTQQGISPCSNNGVVKFRNVNGIEIQESALITRGFKPGITINATEGASVGDTAGNGGGGATGGSGGSGNSGGGGGSGYVITSTSVLSSTIGGNTSTKSTVNFKDYFSPTYSISASATSVNEGSSVNFTVTTTNVTNGTILYWTTTGGVAATDFSDDILSGQVTVSGNSATITRSTKNDGLTEGNETFQIEIRTTSETTTSPVATSAVVTIVNVESSPPPPTVPPSDSGGGGGGGGGLSQETIYYNVAFKESVTFTISESSGNFNYINIQGIKNFPENNTPNPQTITVNPGAYLVNSSTGIVRVDPNPPPRKVQLTDSGGGTWDDMQILVSRGDFSAISGGPEEYCIYRYGSDPAVSGSCSGTPNPSRRGRWWKAKFYNWGTDTVWIPVWTQLLGVPKIVTDIYIQYLNRPCYMGSDLEGAVNQYNAYLNDTTKNPTKSSTVAKNLLIQQTLNSTERKNIIISGNPTDPNNRNFNRPFPVSIRGRNVGYGGLPQDIKCYPLADQFKISSPVAIFV